MKGTNLVLCQTTKSQATRAVLCKVVLEGDTLPEWVELVPPGPQVNAYDGRKFLSSNPQAVIDVFTRYGLDLPIDYEHASEVRASKGEEAPAAGWIVELQERAGAIWGRVEWTPKGAQSLLNREYRFISPAFYTDKKGEIKELISAGLTNKPALTQLTQLARVQGEEMNPELLKALGLAEGATQEQVISALRALQQAKSDAEAAAATAQSAVVTARSEAQAARDEAARTASTPDLALFVPRSQYDLAVARAQNAEKELNEGKELAHQTKAKAAVDAAVKSGKVAPACKDFFLSTCQTDEGLVEFEKFLASAPVIGNPSSLEGQHTPNQNDALPTEEQIRIAEQCNISREDFIAEFKARNREIA